MSARPRRPASPALALALAALAGAATTHCSSVLGLGDLKDAPPQDADAAAPSTDGSAPRADGGETALDAARDAADDSRSDDPSDANDANHASDANDASDANHASDANDANDANDASDANHASDASDASADAAVLGRWQIQPYDGNVACAQSLAVGDDDGPKLNGVAVNGTWATGCDYAVDSAVFELADVSNGSRPELGFSALDISIGAGPNGHAWVMSRAGEVYEWDGGAFTKRSLSQDLPGVAGLSAYRIKNTSQSTIAVGPDNDPWVVTNVPYTTPGDDGGLQPTGNYLVAHYEKNASTGAWHWVMKGSNGPTPGLVAAQIAVSSAGDLWTISSSPTRTPYTGVVQRWTDLTSPPTTYNTCAMYLAVGPDDTPWILGCTDGNGGQQILKGESHSGTFTAIANSDGSGSVFGILLAIGPKTGTLWFSDWNGIVHVGHPAP